MSYTDVGWSPYFPLISGLITEMGGLVSHGKSELRNVSLSGNIMKGDILIVSYTDVGWLPYFPLISGLNTEMGGLVSHGKSELRNV